MVYDNSSLCPGVRLKKINNKKIIMRPGDGMSGGNQIFLRLNKKELEIYKYKVEPLRVRDYFYEKDTSFFISNKNNIININALEKSLKKVKEK